MHIGSPRLSTALPPSIYIHVYYIIGSSGSAAEDIARLQNEAATYVRRIELERQKVAELDKQIARMQEKILEKKNSLGGVNAVQVNNQIAQKTIKVLEHRMDKELNRYNDLLCQNKILRTRIDEYRRERVVFDGIYKKLEKELHEKKKEMAGIIEESKNAYMSRDKSQSEMVALQAHSEKEKAEFELEFKELGDMIKQQQQLLEQLRLRQFDRTNHSNATMTSTKVEGKTELVSRSDTWTGKN